MHSIKREDLLKAFAPAKVLENQPIKGAVEQVKSFVYNDFTFRTEKGIKKEDIKPSIDKTVEVICNYILQTPNEENQDSFDKKHEKWCREFTTSCGEEADFIATIGKAQKVINMAFKYFYCCQDADEHKHAFQYCHMPLDSLTLEWVYRKVKPTNGKKYTRNNIPAWSKLCYDSSKESASKLSYKSIQEDIRKHFESRNKESSDEYKLTPLTAEFVIWPQIQLELAAEGLFNQLWHIGEGPDDAEYANCKGKLQQASKIFKSKSVKDKLDYLKRHIGLSDDSFIFTDVNT